MMFEIECEHEWVDNPDDVNQHCEYCGAILTGEGEIIYPTITTLSTLFLIFLVPMLVTIGILANALLNK